jgi:hypothetical protein
LRKNNPRVTITAIAIIPPSTVPAIPPTEILALVVSVAVGTTLVAVAVVLLGEGLAVDVGDDPVIQVASSDDPTARKSEEPPWCPWESIIINIMVVPAATSTFQSYDGPSGGWSIVVSPPGMRPKIVIGWIAPPYPLNV